MIDETDWKLKLRYGKSTTPFQHFTVLADGVVEDLKDGFTCRPGRAWMAMRVWATHASESMDMVRAIGAKIGFVVDGRVEVYVTEPDRPPSENPHGYGIKFTPYDDD